MHARIRPLPALRIALAILAAPVALAPLACGDDDGPSGPVEPAPVVDEITVGAVRAGEVLVITGENLTALRSPALAGAPTQVQVLLDGSPLVPESVTATEIRVRIPLSLAPGTHTLAVRVGERTSNTVEFEVEVFTASGIYDGSSVLTFDTCELPFPVGTEREVQILVIDERPAVTFQRGELDRLTGTLAADGSFTAAFTEVEDGVEIDLQMDGELGTDGAGVPELTSHFTVELTDLETSESCRFEEDDRATRISTDTDVLRRGAGDGRSLRGLLPGRDAVSGRRLLPGRR
jgi:hypothetical protein